MGVKKALSCSSGNRKVCKLFTGSITGNRKLKPPRRLQPLHRYATTRQLKVTSRRAAACMLVACASC